MHIKKHARPMRFFIHPIRSIAFVQQQNHHARSCATYAVPTDSQTAATRNLLKTGAVHDKP
ncbi:hypothetical protein [Paraburkholderia lycopersici]|uniref:hypothetical protein n=1 Tax=Paraburkholderia lycopersici TaxID=416944 RepID=UPI0015A22181|nr:hypothetical protein [Paraburkholderia lycopersici]